MKAKRSLVIGILIGGLVGWTLGFLRLPYLEKNISFLLGFIACLALTSLLLVLIFVWNKSSLAPLIGRGKHEGSKNARWMYSLIWILLTGFVLAGGVIGSMIIYRQNESLKIQTQEQKNKVQELNQLISSAKQSNLTFLMRTVLEDISNELNNNPGRTLSDSAIARLTALSYLCKPYGYFEGDSLTAKELSAERGQLLLALVLLNIDSSSFAQIRLNAHFGAADLKGADLKGINLSGINLKGANLKDANLNGTNLSKTNLSDAVLWGAHLNRANLSEADLQKADLGWAQLNEANLQSANLNGADLKNAQLKKADLSNATVQWAQSDGALLTEANLSGVDLLGTSLAKVNLSRANLRDTDLRKINLTEADLNGTVLIRALVEENWLEQLNGWRLIGIKEIQKNYKVVNDSTDKWKKPLHRLQKIY